MFSLGLLLLGSFFLVSCHSTVNFEQTSSRDKGTLYAKKTADNAPSISPTQRGQDVDFEKIRGKSKDILSAKKIVHPPAQPFYGKSWAVVIGINKYKNEKIAPLEYAIPDAEAIAAKLLILGFPQENVFRLIGEQATKTGIEELLNVHLRKAVRQEDRVVIFFAGHGESHTNPYGGEEGFLIPYDADPKKTLTTAIAMGDVKLIGNRLPAKHILFILDACHSGLAAISRNSPAPPTPEQLRRMLEDRAVQVLSAGKTGEKAEERNGHGLFTTYLLKGLEGFADENGDNIITFQELVAFVTNRVVTETGGAQNPRGGQLAGEGLFFFELPQASLADRFLTAGQRVGRAFGLQRGLADVVSPVQSINLPLSEFHTYQQAVAQPEAFAIVQKAFSSLERARDSVEALEALRMIRRAAEQGLPYAQAILGNILTGLSNDDFKQRKIDISAIPLDVEEGISWLRRAAEQGDASGQTYLGIVYLEKDGQQNLEEAAHWIQLAAKQGYAPAQGLLGRMYARGKGVPYDTEKAMHWLQFAAGQGHAASQLWLGKEHFSGKGLPQDDAAAVYWLRLAAEQGTAEAQFILGYLYAVGRGVPEDATAAADWFRPAAEQGYVAAQAALGNMYYAGLGVPQDDVEAARWLQLAAEQGHASAQGVLGIMYGLGSGVEANNQLALYWVRQGAENGDPIAQVALGQIYFSGELGLVPRNETEAVRWFRLSAEQGEENAMYGLGEAYEYGRGVPQDKEQAMAWYRQAADNGHEAARLQLEEKFGIKTHSRAMQ